MIEELLSLWKARRRALIGLSYPPTGSVVYQLDKCIKDLEGQIEYEKRNSSEDIRDN